MKKFSEERLQAVAAKLPDCILGKSTCERCAWWNTKEARLFMADTENLQMAQILRDREMEQNED